MMGSDGRGPAVAGGLARHIPVLGPQAIAHLGVRDGGIYIDGTFGAGGYSRLILQTPNTQVVGIDRDQSAIARGADLVQTADGRLTLIEDRFSALDEVLRSAGFDHADGVVLDLGVSSMQIDEAARGFSFRSDGPLDMRMGRDEPSAADVIAAISERGLATVIKVLGEERHARAVARAIVRARTTSPITTTRALADIVESVVRARPGTIHPATRTFQALRIFVNEELTELAQALGAAERILNKGGRLVVVSFHSLEDRIVKTFMTERGRRTGFSRHRPETRQPEPTFRIITKKPVTPGEDEIANNPRARSAKLRVAERNDADPREMDYSALLPRLPSLADAMKGR
jgi:16S rRNA (cytosine1402-N4)-methyltransferase